MLKHPIGQLEVETGIEPEGGLGGGDLVGAECCTVCLCRVARVGCGPRDGAAHGNERGALLLVHRGLERGVEREDVDVAVRCHPDVVHVPPVGLVATDDVLGECHRGIALDRDVVVVPDDREIAQALHTCE